MAEKKTNTKKKTVTDCGGIKPPTPMKPIKQTEKKDKSAPKKKGK